MEDLSGVTAYWLKSTTLFSRFRRSVSYVLVDFGYGLSSLMKEKLIRYVHFVFRQQYYC